MGCINQKQRQINPGHKIANKYQETQPQMPYQDHHIVKLPHVEVSQRACGYNFIDQKLTNIHHAKTQQTTEEQNSQKIDQLQNLINKCQYYYQQHDIDTAYQYLEEIDQFCSSNKQNEQLNKQIAEKIKDKQRFFQQIREQYIDVINYQKEIQKGGWVQQSNRKGVKVSTRRENGSVGVLVQSIIDQPFQTLITVLVEMNLYKQFIPFLKVSTQQKIVARNCRIGHTQNHFPILSVRQAFFQGIGYNRLHKNNTLFLYTRSINNRPDLQEKLGYKCNVNPDYVQLQYKYLALLYEPICRGKGKVSMVMNADTKIDFIPMWIQDKISQDFGEQFFENIMKISRRFKNSQWEKNTQANPDCYLFFKNAIDKHLTEIQELQKQQGYRGTRNNQLGQ